MIFCKKSQFKYCTVSKSGLPKKDGPIVRCKSQIRLVWNTNRDFFFLYHFAHLKKSGTFVIYNRKLSFCWTIATTFLHILKKADWNLFISSLEMVRTNLQNLVLRKTRSKFQVSWKPSGEGHKLVFDFESGKILLASDLYISKLLMLKKLNAKRCYSLHVNGPTDHLLSSNFVTIGSAVDE